MIRWMTIVILAGSGIALFLLFFNTDAQLNMVKAEHKSTQQTLSLTRTELESTESELDSTKIELESTESELDSTKIELESTRENLNLAAQELESTSTNLDITTTELQSTREELTSVEKELASKLDSISIMQTELDGTKDQLNDLEISYEGLLSGHGYTIKDPTYNEMMDFLKADDTDKAEYIKDKYVCTGFATDLCNNAEEEGIRCAYVTIKFPEEVGHTIVAFDTIDKGLTYIEPQHDDLVRVEIGKPFYECIVPKPGFLYEKPDHDDTIEEVLIAW